MMSFIAFIALTVSCMGLFGLVSLNLAKRMKEISIRKVLGASVTNILRLINKEFITLLLIAIVVAAPLSYLMLKNILELTFQYSMPVGPGPVLLTAALIILTALLTIFSQVYKGATANPVDGLRTE